MLAAAFDPLTAGDYRSVHTELGRRLGDLDAAERAGLVQVREGPLRVPASSGRRSDARSGAHTGANRRPPSAGPSLRPRILSGAPATPDTTRRSRGTRCWRRCKPGPRLPEPHRA